MIISTEFIRVCCSAFGFVFGTAAITYLLYIVFNDSAENTEVQEQIRDYLSKGYAVYVDAERVYSPPKYAGSLSYDVDDETKTVRMW